MDYTTPLYLIRDGLNEQADLQHTANLIAYLGVLMGGNAGRLDPRTLKDIDEVQALIQERLGLKKKED